MNFIKELSNKIINYVSSFKPLKNKNCNIQILDHINEICKNENYNSTFIELDNNSCLDFNSNGILVTLFPKNIEEEQEYTNFIYKLMNDSNVYYGKNKITIRIGQENKLILSSYNYNLIGKIRQYLENLKNFNLVLLTTNGNLFVKI
jgi:hypothetical protein